MVTAGANAGVLLVGAYTLTATAFGMFAAASFAILLVGRFVTFGCEHAFMRLCTLPAHVHEQGALLGAALLVPAILFALVVLAALGTFWAIEPVFRAPVAATLAASAAWAAAELAYWILLARNHPAGALAAQSGSAVIRLVIVTMVAFRWPALDPLLLAWAASGLVSGALAIVAAGRGAQLPNLALVLELVRYARWQGLAQVLSSFAGQQAILMLLLLGGQATEAGKFSLALSLMFGVFFIHAGWFEQLSAEISERQLLSARRFIAAAMRRTAVLCLLCAAILLIEYLLVPLVLSNTLWSNGSVFVPLSLATLILLLNIPLEALLHARLTPRAIFDSRLIRILLVAILGFPIALYGTAEQMGWLQVLAALASFIYLAVRIRRSIAADEAGLV